MSIFQLGYMASCHGAKTAKERRSPSAASNLETGISADFGKHQEPRFSLGGLGALAPWRETPRHRAL
jgi:hypothetical protein